MLRSIENNTHTALLCLYAKQSMPCLGSSEKVFKEISGENANQVTSGAGSHMEVVVQLRRLRPKKSSKSAVV